YGWIDLLFHIGPQTFDTERQLLDRSKEPTQYTDLHDNRNRSQHDENDNQILHCILQSMHRRSRSAGQRKDCLLFEKRSSEEKLNNYSVLTCDLAFSSR